MLMSDLYISYIRSVLRGTLSDFFIDRETRKLKTDATCGINVISLGIS